VRLRLHELEERVVDERERAEREPRAGAVGGHSGKRDEDLLQWTVLAQLVSIEHLRSAGYPLARRVTKASARSAARSRRSGDEAW
jgi:hypothetical protein